MSQCLSEAAQGKLFGLSFSHQIYRDFNKNVFRALKLLNPGFVVVNETFPIKMQLLPAPEKLHEEGREVKRVRPHLVT